jgi:1-acyl-sn-glycerol-3-phosphate acyltransferase
MHIVFAVLLTLAVTVAACSLTYAAWVLRLRAALIRWFQFWTDEGRKVATTSGYLTPYVSRTARVLRGLLAAIFTPIVVGPFKVNGLENIRGFEGRLVWSSNHQLYFDALLFARFFHWKNFRFLIKCDQVRGPQAFALAWIGAISVAVPGSSPRQLVEPIFGAVEAEKKDPDAQTVVCPEGALHPDGVLQRHFWESGVFRIAQRAERATGVPYAIVPVYIAYDHDPAHQSLVQWFVRKSGLMRKMHQLALGKGKVAQHQFGDKAVYGATFYIGKPLPVADLPKRPRPAMDMVFQAELELEAQSKLG